MSAGRPMSDGEPEERVVLGVPGGLASIWRVSDGVVTLLEVADGLPAEQRDRFARLAAAAVSGSLR